MKKVLFVLIIGFNLQVAAQVATFSVVDSLLERGHYQAALKKLKAINPQSYQTNYKIGRVFSAIDKDRKALNFYKKSLALKETYLANLQLGKTYQKLRMYKQAIAVYQKLVDNDSQNFVLAFQLGKLYVRQNKLNKASEIFKNLSKENPTNADYAYQLALIAFAKNDANSMINYFLEAYKTDTTHIKSIYQLAKVFTQIAKDKDSAKLFLNKGLQLDSLHINLNKLKINQLYRSESYQEAIVYLKKIDTLNPNDLFVKKMLGRSYYNLKNYDKAEVNFKKAAQIDSEDFKIYTYLGHIENARKNHTRAMLYYLRATRVGKKPRYEEYYSLGMLYLEQKNLKSAIAMFKKSRAESAGYYKTLYELALTSDSYFKDKKIALAYYQDYLNQFLHRNKKNTEFVLKRVKEIKKVLFLQGK